MKAFKIVEDKYIKNNGAEIKLPQRATSGSAGYDFIAPIDITIPAHGTAMVWSDVKCVLPKGFFLAIFARSSLGTKHGITLANGTGIIDSDYADNEMTGGNIGICLHNRHDHAYNIKAGDKICQGIILNHGIVDNDEPVSEIRTGGFGSSDKK